MIDHSMHNIETKRRTRYSFQSPLLIVLSQIPQLLANDEPKLDLVVYIHALGLENGAGAGEQNRGRGLEEEEGLLWRRGVEFCDVVRVVAAYAHDLDLSIPAQSAVRLAKRESTALSLPCGCS
jgi:hypothetical protein